MRSLRCCNGRESTMPTIFRRAAYLKELKVMKDSLEKVFLLDLKINAPWEEMKFTAWRYKVTNIVISAVHVALKAEDDGEAVKHLFGTGKHSN